ncbi:MAG: GGDEF domain-containing protein, partial [Hyphomicrobiales bacterium]
ELKAKLAEQENDTFIALLDIDHFKTVNDQHGHIVGDQVLKLIATQIKKLIRPQDILCRYGGEEFALLFRMTPQETCLSVIESVRKGVAKQNIQNRRSGEFMGSITLSAGLSKVHAGDDFESAIERSDRLLYIAKNRGRNQVAF